MLLAILEQFKAFLQQHAIRRGHITVTGGEPFLYDRFLDLLAVFSRSRKLFSFAILTNGSCMDSALAKELKRLCPAFVQVSLEGTPETHDRIRGIGNYSQTIKAIKLLVAQGIRTYISFTAHQGNYQEFTRVAQVGRRLGVARVWADRLIPHHARQEEQILRSDEHRSLLRLMDKERRKVRWFGKQRTEIAMHRALQFLVAGGQPYHCAAGDTLVTVMPNGDLYPCRRMPIPIGNLRKHSLAELYQHSELLQQLRERRKIPTGCTACLYQYLCRGGLKCLAYAVSGDPFAGDPGCWLREQ